MGLGTNFKRWRRDVYRRHILRDPFHRAIKRWHEDQGERLRLEYPLREDSIVIDVGGYVGDFAADLTERFDCSVHLFEPVPDFYERCVKRFSGNSKVSCYCAGLSNADGQIDISLQDDASSTNVLHSRANTQTIELKRASAFIESLEIIDLFKINIEGGEYQVLPDLIASGEIKKVEYLQIQFHDFIENAVPQRDAIVAELSKTHERQWCYDFVWESWKRT